MESSVLNLAHEKQRRAEAYLKKGQFDEAVECHEIIANLLLQAQQQLQANTNAKFCSFKSSSSLLINDVPRLVTLQSIALQKDYHKRQALIVRMKQARYEQYKAKIESQKNEILIKQTSEKYQPNYFSSKEEETLHQTVFKTIEKQENLLSLISLPEDGDKAIKPKDLKNVIDEMHSVNSQLKSYLCDLLNQLDLKDQEIKRLKELQMPSNLPNEETPLDSIHSVHLEPLPPLAPIEMPEFNLNSA